MKYYMIIILLIIPSLLSSQESWKTMNGPYGAQVRTLCVDSTGKIWAGTYHGIFVSTDQGKSWMKRGSYYYVPTNIVINSRGKIFATNYWGGFSISTDQGITWQETNSPGYHDVRYLYADAADRLFAGTDQGLYRSTNDGETWTLISFISDNGAIGEDSHGRLYSSRGASIIYYSTDFGDSWNSPDTMIIPQTAHYITNFAFNSKEEIFGGSNDGILYSRDKGKTWQLSRIDSNYIFVNSVSIDKDDNIYAGTNLGVYISSTNDLSWKKIDVGFNTFSCYATCVDSSGTVYAGMSKNILARTTDQGKTWSVSNDGLTDISLTTIDMNIDDDLLVGSGCNNIYFSTDRGSQWTPIYTFPSSKVIKTLNWGENKEIFAGTDGGGFYYSSDLGSSWVSLNIGVENGFINSFLIGSPNKYFACGYGGIYASTDKGITWTQISSSAANVLKKNNRGDIIAGFNGVSISEDMGITWNACNNNGFAGTIESLSVYSDSIFFAGNGEAGLYRSLDKGKNWIRLKSEVGSHGEPFPIKAIGINSKGYVYTFVPYTGSIRSYDLGQTWESSSIYYGNAIVFDKNDYMIVISDGVYISNASTATSVQKETTNNLVLFRLDQNYPNPFNPSTKISFNLPTKSYVSLKVFDLLGREVATIVSKEMSAGNHSQEWNANGLSSGVYFYRLQAGSFTETKKIVLLR